MCTYVLLVHDEYKPPQISILSRFMPSFHPGKYRSAYHQLVLDLHSNSVQIYSDKLIMDFTELNRSK